MDNWKYSVAVTTSLVKNRIQFIIIEAYSGSVVKCMLGIVAIVAMKHAF